MAEDKLQEVRKKQAQEVTRVLAGHNDTFEKEYEFKEMDLKFKIKLKFPSLIDQAEITGLTERYFGGMGLAMNAQFVGAVKMLMTIQFQQNKYGEDSEEVYIPRFLRNVEEVYNPSILAEINRDFVEWMNTFQY